MGLFIILLRRADKMPEDNLKIPRHVAFIMDGNGRWAKKRFMPRTYGHREGVKALKTVIRSLESLGVEYATFYAFSTENWSRPDDEVAELMRIFDEQLDSLTKYVSDNIRLRFIGDRTKLSANLQEKMAYYEKQSAEKTGMTVIIAINYGGYDEICRAAGKICELAREGFVTPKDITPDFIQSFLDTKDFPNVDLLVRTGGEMRLSNFLLWQTSYAEFYFCDTLWPDFNEKSVMAAIKEYSSRDRRFGGVKNT